MGEKRAHVKPEQNEEEDAKTKKAKEEDWEPDNWKEVYENIRKMRKDRSAACDMGKDKTSKYTEKERRFHVLISLMLSSQTKDEVNHAAVERLKGTKFDQNYIFCLAIIIYLSSILIFILFSKSSRRNKTCSRYAININTIELN